MSDYEIINLLKFSERIDVDTIICTNPEKEANLRTIFEFLKELNTEKLDLIEELINTNFRFCDYYGFNNVEKEEIIEYFLSSYRGSDKEEKAELFAIYVLLRNAIDMIMAFDICDNFDELYELLDNDSYFEEMLSMIEYVKDREMVLEDDTDDLGFLNPDNKYKILFTGTSYRDIKHLQKRFKKAFIKKISGQLSNSDVITLAECVDHVKELYGFPIFRIQFGNDYRIAYIRRDNVTAILGVTMKSGKDKDYTRYDAIAKQEALIYKEIQMLLDGTLPEESEHYKTIEHLEDFIQKIKEQ